MSIKLLPKSEIDARKAAEQHTAVQEGVKLARRVDNLREVAAEEEASLSEYRVKTLTAIHEETKEAAEKRDILKGEVSTLEDRKREALKPIEEERELLNLDKAAFNIKKEDLDTRVSAVEAREIDCNRSRDEANSLLNTATIRENTAHEDQRRAAEAREAAELALKDAAELKTGTLLFEREVKDALIHREEVVVGRENSATLREKEIETEKKELAEGWRLLKDRELMLERNLKRNS